MNPVDATAGGGLAARRAIVRWAWRVFRREWRQQALVLGLLTAVVAAAIGGASAAYNVAPVSGNAMFGAASHLVGIDGSDPRSLGADLVAAEEWFGTIDVIGRRNVPVPGSFDPIEFRSQDPRGPYVTRPLRLPTSSGDGSEPRRVSTRSLGRLHDLRAAACARCRA